MVLRRCCVVAQWCKPRVQKKIKPSSPVPILLAKPSSLQPYQNEFELISLYITLEFINQLPLLKSQKIFLDFLVKTTKPSSNMTPTINPSSGSQPWNRHFFLQTSDFSSRTVRRTWLGLSQLRALPLERHDVK